MVRWIKRAVELHQSTLSQGHELGLQAFPRQKLEYDASVVR
jgi:hypothetical protein